MKKLSVAVLMVTLALTWGAGVQAQEKIRVGIVDGRKVLFESAPGKQFRAEMEKMVKDRQTKLSEEEKKIKALRDAAERDKLLLTDKQKEEKRQELEQKFADYQKMRQEMQKQLADHESGITREMSRRINDVVAQVAKEEKLTLVLDKSQPTGIVWVEEPIDITARVLKAYEAKAGK